MSVDSKSTTAPPDQSQIAENVLQPANAAFAALDEQSFSQAERLRQIKEFGNFSLAYSTAVQPGVSYFGNAQGYLAFMRMFGFTFVLGDPVVSPDGRGELLDAFLRAYRKPSFCQISRGTAELLHDRKFWINEMGVDTALDLPNYDFSGKAKERFRYAANWLNNRDYTIKELSYEEVATEQVKSIVDSWRKSKSARKEGAFLNRPFTFADEPGVRTFFLFDPNEIAVAFIVFDPIYEQGELVGYVTSFKRRAKEAPSQAEAGISKFAIEELRKEGVQRVMLGLSPLANIEDKEFRRSNPLMRFSFRSGFKSRLINKYFYNIQGHADYKRRFIGVEEKCYYASPVFMNDLRHFCIMRLTKVI